jgi:3',5'-cyclic AMP phosphodiesterase CpdA
MDTFRLLHISDLHLAVRPYMVGFPDWKYLPQFPAGSRVLGPSSHDPDLTEAAARWLYRHANRFDAVLVTGDLATTGHAADLGVAHNYLFAPAAAGYLSQAHAPTLQAGGVPLCHLPGNHDRFDGLYMGPGSRQFDTAFGQSGWSAGQGAQTLIVLQGAAGEKLAVLGADFCLASYWDSKGVWGYLGQGKVYPNVLQSLRRTTLQELQAHGPQVGIVWVIHFPPAFAGIDPDLALLDEPQVLAAARQLGVEHLFCGHTHEAREYTAPGQPAVQIHCAGTTAQYITQHGNVMHETELDVSAGVVTAVRRTNVWWDQRAGAFV